jgi:hypothetical protein
MPIVLEDGGGNGLGSQGPGRERMAMVTTLLARVGNTGTYTGT